MAWHRQSKEPAEKVRGDDHVSKLAAETRLAITILLKEVLDDVTGLQHLLACVWIDQVGELALATLTLCLDMRWAPHQA